jgi:P4 family phage/plasmid primase-like protien
MSRKNLALAPGVIKPRAAHIAEVIKDVPKHFAQDGFEAWGARRLWRYRRGVYQPRGAETVAKYTKAILRASHLEDSWSTRLASETTEYLRTDAPELPNAPSLETLNVLNGLVDVRTGKLRPHDPTFLSTVQLPVIYIKDATCPAWERQIKETWPADAVEAGLPWAIIAYLMLPITALQKAILLLGEAGSGKSVFLASLIAFLGLANVSAVTLQKLEEDRFAASMLIGKLANIFADLPSQHLETSAIFKSITGGDLVPAEFKFRDQFSFRPFARLVFSSNQPPISRDASDAFFERWLVVPFEKKFRGTVAERNREELDRELASPAELSGALNRALDALPGLLKNGLPEPESCRLALEEFRTATDPFSVWLSREVVTAAEIEIAKEQLHQHFNAFALRHGRQPMTATMFSLALKRHLRGIGEGKSTINGKRALVWRGVGLRLVTPDVDQSEDAA